MANAKAAAQHLDEISLRNSEALEGLKGAIDKINDTNILHLNALQKNTEAILAIEKFWGKIVLILVTAISVLAGAEKVLGLFGK